MKHDNDNHKPRRPIGGQACTNEDFVPHNKVYVAAGSYDVKIGTSKDVYRRFGEIRRETCDDIDIVGIFLGNEYLERRLHRHFVEYNYGSGTEWFRREGRLAEWIDAGCPDELTVSLYYERSSRSA